MIHTTADTATWTDGDVTISVAYSHLDTDQFGTRTMWAYTIRAEDWAHAGRDLSGPYIGELDPVRQLAALISFLVSDAEKYQRLMGPAPEDEDGYLFPLWLAEWAYVNDDTLSMASLELSDEDADD